MGFVYAVIKGEQALKAYCSRRWKGQRIQWTGVFGHIDECTVETIWAFEPDGQCAQYFILYLPHPKGEHNDQNAVRHQVYEEIRQGTIKLLNV